MKQIALFMVLFGLSGNTTQAAQCSKTLKKVYGGVSHYVADLYARLPYFSQSSLNREFHELIDANKISAAQDLVRLGVNVNAQDNNGVTPLMKAAKKKHVDFMKFLVVQGAARNLKEFFTRDNDGKTVIDYVGDPNSEPFKVLVTTQACLNYCKAHQEYQ